MNVVCIVFLLTRYLSLLLHLSLESLKLSLQIFLLSLLSEATVLHGDHLKLFLEYLNLTNGN